METEEILKELEYLKPGHFPREALEAAIAQPEAVTPHLLAVLEDESRLLERLEAENDYMLPIYAFFLLSQFRETRAYPLIVAFFSQPGERPIDVTGDFVTEDLGRVLASVSGGDPGPMKTLIENPQVNEYTRSSVMDGLLAFFVEDDITREAVIATSVSYTGAAWSATTPTPGTPWSATVPTSIPRSSCPRSGRPLPMI